MVQEKDVSMSAIQTTHVGSLPRPQEMMGKILRKQEITHDDLRQYVTGVIERQLQLGMTYINNGEVPRMDYVRSTVGRIAGFDDTGIAPLPKDLEELPELSRRFGRQNGLITLNPKAEVQIPACSQQLTYTGKASLRKELDMMVSVFDQVRRSYPDTDAKLFFTSPSPGTLALFLENKYYPDYETYLERLGAVLKQEYEIIAGYGIHLQIDCPDLAMGRHTRFKHLSDHEFLALMETNISVLNQALASTDPGKSRVHICWGNYPGTHHSDIELKMIIDKVLSINAKFISLEASNHRHAHEWAVFGEVALPDDKILMPGVIDTSSNTVEHPDLVAQRLLNFAKVLGPEKIIGSTDCGFASTASASSVSGEVAWMKLASLVEGARRAGRQLG
jgi:5-methyltetrahydropteroyltriglutamate--homocysteine methyltransferase